MKALRFHTVIGDDQVIRLPKEMQIAPGAVEVIVLRPEEQAKENGPPAEPVTSPWPLVERLRQAAQDLGVNDLPPDLAENHDHYLYGVPKDIDKQ